ncbi:EF-hand domain-containing protein [Nonomuraea sp. NPDC050556]|uniref:EF-hand domain-containing protein n=1 Tax=Nonomuraea sp. NPDC050556 TaxID=3364369 RepID=UPI0037885258
MDDYKITFGIVDADGDGRISAEELVRLMEVLGQPITIESAQASITKLDQDGDGLIDVEEFGAFLNR